MHEIWDLFGDVLWDTIVEILLCYQDILYDDFPLRAFESIVMNVLC